MGCLVSDQMKPSSKTDIITKAQAEMTQQKSVITSAISLPSPKKGGEGGEGSPLKHTGFQ